MDDIKQFNCNRSRLHGFPVDWIVDVDKGELLLVVPNGDKLDIAPYNEDFTLTFVNGKLEELK